VKFDSCRYIHIAPLEEQCDNSKNAHFDLCPEEVCLRPYLPSGIAWHVYFLKWLRKGRSVVVLLMRLHRPGQWVFLSPEKLYFSSFDSVLRGVRYTVKGFSRLYCSPWFSIPISSLSGCMLVRVFTLGNYYYYYYYYYYYTISLNVVNVVENFVRNTDKTECYSTRSPRVMP
jgi:hypothetical protein